MKKWFSRQIIGLSLFGAMVSVGAPLQAAGMENLPVEIVTEIFKHLRPRPAEDGFTNHNPEFKGFLAAGTVSKKFHAAMLPALRGGAVRLEVPPEKLGIVETLNKNGVRLTVNVDCAVFADDQWAALTALPLRRMCVSRYDARGDLPATLKNLKCESPFALPQLARLPLLRTLEVGGPNTDPAVVSLIPGCVADYLRTTPVLRHLGVYDVPLTSLGGLERAIGENQHLASLSLRGTQLGTDRRGLAEIQQIMVHSSSVAHLDLCNTRLPSFHTLRTALKNNRVLRSLNLSCNSDVDMSMVGPLAMALKKHPTMETLILRKSNISMASIASLCGIFRTNTGLRIIDLEENALDPESLEYFNVFLPQNQTLERLDLSIGNLTPQERSTLTDARVEWH